MTKPELNKLLSDIADKHEADMKALCKSANLYYPPANYVSIRGSKNYDRYIGS